jgi:hypothetical protein
MAESVKNGSWNRRGKPFTVRIATVLLLTAGGLAAGGVYLAVAGGSTASASPADEKAAVVEPVDGTALARITLSRSAMKRLDVQTAPVRNVKVQGKQRTVVAYGAVLYDSNGRTWVYTSPKPRTFIRGRIKVEFIDGNRAVLSAGPGPGVRVAIVGVAELWGTELGIGGK